MLTRLLPSGRSQLRLPLLRAHASLRASLQRQLPPGLLEQAQVFHLRGGIDYQKLSPAHRAVMGLLYRALCSKPAETLPAEDRALIETYGKQVDFEDVHTEGITNISAEDFQYARQMKKCIKLLGKSWSDDGKLYAMVCPMLIDHYHPLAGVKDVFNAIFVHGNMVDDTMFYGRGAGKLPTASAVAADVVDCVKHMGTHIKMIWEQEKLPLSDFGGFERRYFVRMPKEVSLESVEKAFGAVEPVKVDDIEETAFVTGVMKESDYHKAADQFDDILNMIRIDA